MICHLIFMFSITFNLQKRYKQAKMRDKNQALRDINIQN